LKGQNWINKYLFKKLVNKTAILVLLQAMDNPPQNADPELNIHRSLLPNEVFARPIRHKE
jgi:hypothetical protein